MSSDAGRRSGVASPQLVLAVACAAVVLASLDLFIVNVALGDIASDFDADLSAVSWVLNAYAIVFAALLVLAGRTADRYPRQAGFLAGLATFTIASALCALATSTEMLVAFRVVQAAGAALLTPTSLGLVLATAAADRRQAYVRVWTAVGGLGAALGPVLGGLLVALSWRWTFLVNVPIGVFALLVGLRRLPHLPGHPIARPDASSAALITAGIALLTLALVKGPGWGWDDANTLASFAGAAVALALFATRTATHANPLIDRALLQDRPFTVASGVAAVISAAFGGMLLSIVLWTQDVWGYSSVTTGLAIAPGPLLVPVFATTITGRLVARFEAGRVVALGCVVFAAGTAWWAIGTRADGGYAADMLGGMMLTGAGVGLFLPAIMASATARLPPASFAGGSAVVTMMRQLGIAVGIAVVVAMLGASAADADQRSFHEVWWVLTAIAVVGALVALSLPARSASRASAVPARSL